jgi:large subunit ribosomal protein L18
MKHTKKTTNRLRRKARVRKHMLGSASRPRMTVFRSNLHIYAQIIDDDTGNTLVSASSRLKEIKSDGEKGKKGVAKQVGALVAQRAKDAGVTQVVFDRNGYKYHGRVAALADGAREGGLSF